MPKNIEGLYAGKADNINRIYETPTECSVCGKPYEIKNKTLMFKRCTDGSMDLICPKCYEKFLKSWDLKEVKSFVSDGTGRGGIIAHCIMTDGSERNYISGYVNPIEAGIPKLFVDKFTECREKYLKEVNDARIKSIETVDTFDCQKFIITQNSGAITEINYKIGRTGLIFNDSDVTAIKPEFMALIKTELNK